MDVPVPLPQIPAVVRDCRNYGSRFSPPVRTVRDANCPAADLYAGTRPNVPTHSSHPLKRDRGDDQVPARLGDGDDGKEAP